MKKIIFIAGSLREKSFNKMLAQAACNMASKHAGIDAKYVDISEYEMPVYNGDIEDKSGLPDSAKKLKLIFADSDGIFISTPEYNSSYSSVLKNTIDWISRKESDEEAPLVAFRGKAALITSTSPGGMGGIRALVPLRLLLSNIGVNVMGDQLAIPFAHTVFDPESGDIIDDAKAQELKTLVDSFVEHVKR